MRNKKLVVVLTKWLIVAILLVSVVVLVGVTVVPVGADSLSIRERASRNEEWKVVELASPESGILSLTLSFPTYIEPDSSTTISPQASGILELLEVEIGDVLEQGDPIGKIDSSSLSLNLRIAEAEFKLAQSNMTKLQKLYDANGMSQKEYEEALSYQEISRNKRDLARLQLGFSGITAPFSGTVLKIHTSEGTLVSPGMPIITMGDLSFLKVRANIPEEYYERFHSGVGEWKIRVIRRESGGFSTDATLFRISPVISPGSRSFEVVSRIDNTEQRLKPGMVVKVEFTVSEEEGFYLPVKALQGRDTLYYIMSEEGEVIEYQFSSPIYDENRIRVPDELQGYQFVVFGPENLKAGDRVRGVPGETLRL